MNHFDVLRDNIYSSIVKTRLEIPESKYIKYDDGTYTDIMDTLIKSNKTESDIIEQMVRALYNLHAIGLVVNDKRLLFTMIDNIVYIVVNENVLFSDNINYNKKNVKRFGNILNKIVFDDAPMFLKVLLKVSNVEKIDDRASSTTLKNICDFPFIYPMKYNYIPDYLNYKRAACVFSLAPVLSRSIDENISSIKNFKRVIAATRYKSYDKSSSYGIEKIINYISGPSLLVTEIILLKAVLIYEIMKNPKLDILSLNMNMPIKKIANQIIADDDCKKLFHNGI